MEAKNSGHLFQCCNKARSVWDILGSDLGSPSVSLCRDFRPGVMCQICAKLRWRLYGVVGYCCLEFMDYIIELKFGMGDLENQLLILSSGVRTISSPLNAPLHLLEVEAEAMGESIRFAWQMGNYDAVLEGDSQKVVVHSLLGSSISSLSISNNI